MYYKLYNKLFVCIYYLLNVLNRKSSLIVNLVSIAYLLPSIKVAAKAKTLAVVFAVRMSTALGFVAWPPVDVITVVTHPTTVGRFVQVWTICAKFSCSQSLALDCYLCEILWFKVFVTCHHVYLSLLPLKSTRPDTLGLESKVKVLIFLDRGSGLITD